MKKIFSILSIVALMASFASCDPMDSGDDTQKPGIENPDNNGDDTPTPTPPTEGEGNENEGEGNENEGEGEGGTDTPVPPTPTKTLTLTLDCTSWPFEEESVTAAKTTDAAGDNLTITQDAVSYTFNIMNTIGGYYHTGSALRGNNKKAGDFKLTLPTIDDMKLISVKVEVTNAPSENSDNRKYIKIIGAGEVVSCTINNTDGLNELVTKAPEIGGKCALESGGNNVQFKTIILTYTN